MYLKFIKVNLKDIYIESLAVVLASSCLNCHQDNFSFLRFTLINYKHYCIESIVHQIENSTLCIILLAVSFLYLS